MAKKRPPIIISTGSGVASELVKGMIVKEGDPTTAEEKAAVVKIKANVAALNDRMEHDYDNRPVLKRMKVFSKKAAFYWRLNHDPKDPDEGVI
ncbi:MAG: hypothetical protein HQ556_07750 [Candidatus Marinimicrobia bacterium]|nr:hypothetical protein [Candidatus Neomarinimicrobiota bacterium]